MFYTFDIGLYQVSVGGGAIGKSVQLVAEASGLPERVRNVLVTLTQGNFPLSDICDRMCQLPTIGGDYCGIWVRLRIASTICMFSAVIGAVVHLLGAFFLYRYWNGEARRNTRRVYTLLLLLPPVIYTMNLTQYCALTMDLADFPPRTQGSSWGACLIFSMMITFFSFVPLAVVSTVAKKALDEDLVEARHNLKNAESDASIELQITNRMQALENPQSAYGSQAPGAGYSQQAPPANQYAGYAPNYGQPAYQQAAAPAQWPQAAAAPNAGMYGSQPGAPPGHVWPAYGQQSEWG